MDGIPHLHVSMPHVEKLADFLVLLLPIFSLTSLGTIQGGLALSAVLELEIRRCHGSTDDAAPEHDCCLNVVFECSMCVDNCKCNVVDERDPGYREAYRSVSMSDCYPNPEIDPIENVLNLC
jgi:hypothetical protein